MWGKSWTHQGTYSKTILTPNIRHLEERPKKDSFLQIKEEFWSRFPWPVGIVLAGHNIGPKSQGLSAPRTCHHISYDLLNKVIWNSINWGVHFSRENVFSNEIWDCNKAVGKSLSPAESEEASVKSTIGFESRRQSAYVFPLFGRYL